MHEYGLRSHASLYCLLIAGLVGLQPVASLSAQDDVGATAAEATRIRRSIAADVDVLLEELRELRLINETNIPRVRGSEWSDRMSAIDSGVSVVASGILALKSLDRNPTAPRAWRVPTQLEGSASQMRRAYGALARASDTHSTRTAIMHLAAILEVIREAIGTTPRCCTNVDRGRRYDNV